LEQRRRRKVLNERAKTVKLSDEPTRISISGLESQISGSPRGSPRNSKYGSRKVPHEPKIVSNINALYETHKRDDKSV
jgi:hypothetical protein